MVYLWNGLHTQAIDFAKHRGHIYECCITFTAAARDHSKPPNLKKIESLHGEFGMFLTHGRFNAVNSTAARRILLHGPVLLSSYRGLLTAADSKYFRTGQNR